MDRNTLGRKLCWVILGIAIAITTQVCVRSTFAGGKKVDSPFDKYNWVAYSKRNVRVMLDPHDRVFGVEYWQSEKRNGSANAQKSLKLETRKVVFNASPADIQRLFGRPTARRSAGTLTSYEYFVEKDGTIYLAKGVKVFEFHKDKLSAVISWFVPFEIGGTVRSNEGKSELLKAIGRPECSGQSDFKRTSAKRQRAEQ